MRIARCVAVEHRRQPPPQAAAVELQDSSAPKRAKTSARSSSQSLSSVSSSWLRTKRPSEADAGIAGKSRSARASGSADPRASER